MTQEKQQSQAMPGLIVNSYTSSNTSNMESSSTASGMSSSGMSSSGGGQKTVVGVFQDRSQAERAVQTLRSQGFTHEEISIVSKKQQGDNSDQKTYDDDISDGALTGGTLGGIGGLLLGVGALAIPGVGPIVAAGPIAAALSGALAGGVAGGLIDWGIPAEASRRYEQSIAQGGILAVIRSTDSAKVDKAAQILRQNNATDVESHSSKQ